MNIAEAACDQKLSVLIFSLEMSRTNLMQKILASQARTQYQNIRSGRLESVEYARLEKASERIQGWQLRIDDTPGLTFPELRGKARKLKRTGLDVIVIDYLQLLQLPSGSNRVHALGEVSRGLKTLARELKITVFALSQLNRSVDGRDDKRPRMSDLRDSGELEQDGDTIIFPYRPAAYCQLCRDNTKTADHDPREHQALAEIIIEKQRNGERNISIPAVWLGAYQRFTDKVVDVF
jgi:replicative DNA helicase